MSLLLREDQDRVAILTLNRPDKHNALNPALRDALLDQLKVIGQQTDVRVVILTGQGKSFCSGLDLGDLRQISQRSTEGNRLDSERLATLFETIYRFPKPVIAAINGHAIAGGAGLASVCDLCIMSHNAKIGYSEAKIGFVAALVGVFLLRQVGEKRARDLLLSARMISATEAQQMGLVNEVVAADQVLFRAQELAQTIMQNSPASLSMTKNLLATVPSLGLREALSYATELNALSRTSDDLKEGLSAFLEKRSPRW